MTAILGDFRDAFRALRARPAIAVLAVVCLTLGIGANTMIFSALNATLLEAPPLVEADRLMSITEVDRSAASANHPVSLASFLDWQASADGVAELAAMRTATLSVGANESVARPQGAFATVDYFDVLGLDPVLGRGFEPGDDTPGGAPVAVLDEVEWQRRHGADPAIIGRTLTIDGRPHTVVGVIPSLLHPHVPRSIRDTRVWLPLVADAERAPANSRTLDVVARLEPGVSRARAEARFAVLAEASAQARPENAGWSVRLGQFGAYVSPVTRSMVWLMMAAVALMLVIACANVANLMLAAATRRRHEFAIRTAAGGSRLRIVRQLLIESLVVAAASALLGMLLARWGIDYLTASTAPYVGELAVPIDATAAAFTVAVTSLSTLLIGTAPALQAARSSTRALLNESGFGATPGRGHERMRQGLVVAQVALALVLLIGASLLLRSFFNLLSTGDGVDAERLVSTRVAFPDVPVSSADDVARDVEALLSGLAALPGVESVAGSDLFPLRGGGRRSVVTRASNDASAAERGPTVSFAVTTPGFFETLGVPLLRGRSLGPDDSGRPFAVVNERMVALLWPGEDPIGKQFRLEAIPALGWATVVGVARDLPNWDAGSRTLPTAFLHFEALDARAPPFFFLRAAGGAPLPNAAAVARSIASLGGSIEVVETAPMEEARRSIFWRQELMSLMLGVFGLAALLLTVIGVYGVLAYHVWLKGREIGIRIAFGGGDRRILGMVLRQGTQLIAVGVVVGLGGAFALARVMRRVLFGVEPFDLPLFATVTVCLVGVAFAACVVPAYRAARIDPNVLLRD